MKFIQITDPHLSDNIDTATWQAFHWALDQVHQHRPDLLIVTGDITTYGNRKATQRFIDLLAPLPCPVFFTPGNAEHRGKGAMPLLSDLCVSKFTIQKDTLFLFPDTSKGTVPSIERTCLEQTLLSHSHVPSRVIATHYPLDVMDKDSRNWLKNYLAQNRIELLLAGHRHIQRSRQIGSCTEIVSRGLDPDKAIGDLPGVNLFVKSETGWSETHIPWDFPIALQPSSPAKMPVGWSIQGDPIDATEETRTAELSCLELRPKDLSFSASKLDKALTHLRREQNVYLSWHLPNLSWDGQNIDGTQTVKDHLKCALDVGVNHLTVHVPGASAHAMTHPDLWQKFENLYVEIFQTAVESGVRLAMENVHNHPGVKPQDEACKFATDIPTYLKWITTIRSRFGNVPNVGAHFDTGHARNNGEYGNMYPLSEWYAWIGQHILGYHIHQIGAHPETGKTINHIEMHTLFDSRISYAGFCYAWSNQQINRAPLFVEIRDAEQRRRSTLRLKKLFESASQIHTSLDLPCRNKKTAQNPA